MGKKLPMFIRITLGIIFLILGIIGLLLPVIPQVLFFVLAAGFLGWDGLRLYVKRVRNKFRGWFS